MKVFFLPALAVMLMVFVISPRAWADVGPRERRQIHALPVNPSYLEYWEKTRAGDRPNGLIPSPINWSLLKGKTGRGASGLDATSVDLPRSFDLVAKNVTPPVKDQLSLGTCWTFGAIEAIESSVISADKTNGTHNYKELSELHLAYYAYMDEGPDKPAFKAWSDEDEDEDEDEANPIFDRGGSAEMVLALLSRGTGPLAEEDAPYPKEEDVDDWTTYVPDPPPAKGPAQFRLKNAYYFWNEPEAIKRALMKFGGLAFAFGIYKDTVSGDCIYTSGDLGSNHEVLLVGWDDDYPKEAFGPDDQPRGNGAWKIQNSWGADAGKDGFYWISYEDGTLFSDNSSLPIAFEMQPVDAYDGIYFHDPLGMSSVFPDFGESRLTVANAFVAKRDESIVSVGFMTAQDDMDYEIQIYRGIPAGGAPDAGSAVFETPVLRHVDDGGGFVSVQFDSPVRIDKDERFAVAVTYKSLIPDEDFPEVYAPVEAKSVPGYEKAGFNEGESYVLWFNKEWGDAHDESSLDVLDPNARGNFCIKAFTVPNDSSGNDSSGGCDAGIASLLAISMIGAGALFAGKKIAFHR
jgi:C1A family cysteine protease